MENISSQLTDKLRAIEDWYAQRQGSIVAFSGGIDSALVLFLARKFQGKENAIGVISNSESLKNTEFIPLYLYFSLYPGILLLLMEPYV